MFGNGIRHRTAHGQGIAGARRGAASLREEAVPKCLMLRFTLAYLYSVSRVEPDLFIRFWQTVTEPPRPGESEAICATGRRQNANAILNGIYLRRTGAAVAARSNRSEIRSTAVPADCKCLPTEHDGRRFEGRGEMRGQVLGMDTRTGDGIVVGDDGRRYKFGPSDWAHRGEPAVGMYVDFESNETRALSIFPVPGTSPPAPVPPAPARTSMTAINMLRRCSLSYSGRLGSTVFIWEGRDRASPCSC